MHPIFFQLGWNLDGDWPIRRQNPYQHQFVNVNNNNYTCCAKMAGKEAPKRGQYGLVNGFEGDDGMYFYEVY
jgi:hypothetical protein